MGQPLSRTSFISGQKTKYINSSAFNDPCLFMSIFKHFQGLDLTPETFKYFKLHLFTFLAAKMWFQLDCKAMFTLFVVHNRMCQQVSTNRKTKKGGTSGTWRVYTEC